MRYCWNDWFRGPLRDLTLDEAKLIRSIGFEVAGINCGDVDATDADIDHIKGIFDQAGLIPGPYGAGSATFHPDPAVCKEYKKNIAKALRIAGKIGCTGLRYSIGSMDPKNVWINHPENHTQKALDLLIESTKELVPIAEDSRVMLCPETTQWTIVNGVERMKEYVDRLNSPYAKVCFDFVNHMTAERIVDSGVYIKQAVATLGDRIGEFHVKDVQVVPGSVLVVHIDETKMGTGVLNHAAIMEASNDLEPWKTFSLEHIGYDYKNPENVRDVKLGHDYILSYANRIGHRFTDAKLTREKWEKENKK
jgi:sugar phosphate isomerase/epimerase